MKPEPIVLRSPLPPVELALRLKAVAGNNPRHIAGAGSEQTLQLWVSPPNIRNDFKIRLEADLLPDGGGTRIEGDFAQARQVRMFMVMWFGFLACFLILTLGIVIVTRPPLEFSLPFAGIPLAMMLFGLGLRKFGARLSGDDRRLILEFLAETVDARPVAERQA